MSLMLNQARYVYAMVSYPFHSHAKQGGILMGRVDMFYGAAAPPNGMFDEFIALAHSPASEFGPRYNPIAKFPSPVR